MQGCTTSHPLSACKLISVQSAGFDCTSLTIRSSRIEIRLNTGLYLAVQVHPRTVPISCNFQNTYLFLWPGKWQSKIILRCPQSRFGEISTRGMKSCYQPRSVVHATTFLLPLSSFCSLSQERQNSHLTYFTVVGSKRMSLSVCCLHEM